MLENKQLMSDRMLTDKVEREIVHVLYKQAPMSFISGVLASIFVAIIISPELPRQAVFTWLATMLFVITTDFVGYWVYRFRRNKIDNLRGYYTYFVGSVAVLSSSWGIGAVILMSMLTVPFQLFMVMVLVAITGGALAALSVRTMPQALFYTGMLLPPVIWLVGQENHLLFYTGIFLFIYGVVLWLGGKDIGVNLSEALRIKFENENLADSLKLSNTQLQTVNQELTQISSTDGLTGVANRRYFDNYFEKEWKRLSREGMGVAVVMLDVDNFKMYNDSLGHQAGDSCLIQVAQSIKASLRRPADMVARYGGEEFIILLPNTSKVGAVRVAEFIRENILHLKIPHPQSETSEWVTISLGAAYCEPQVGMMSADLISKADEALYSAKKEGRNNVKFASLEPTDLVQKAKLKNG